MTRHCDGCGAPDTEEAPHRVYTARDEEVLVECDPCRLSRPVPWPLFDPLGRAVHPPRDKTLNSAVK